MSLAEIILGSSLIYLAVGVIFALYFVIFRVGKYDEAAKNSGIIFRFVIFFGAVIFWLLLVWQIIQNKEKIEVTAHRL
jgi:hypothetical protein